MEELKGVTKLRNGKVISKPDLEPLDSEILEEEDDDTKENSPTVEEVKYEPPIPFPSALFPKTRNNKKNVEGFQRRTLRNQTKYSPQKGLVDYESFHQRIFNQRTVSTGVVSMHLA